MRRPAWCAAVLAAVVALAALSGHPTAAAPMEVLGLSGSGTTNLQKWLVHMLDILSQSAGQPTYMTYRGIGSSNGHTDFENHANDFNCADIPLETETYDAITADDDVLTLPLAIGAVGVFYDVPGGTLLLRPCVAAQIFSGQITQWDDTRLVADNPWLASAGAGKSIRVVRRSDGSSSTKNFSGWLAKACPNKWSLGSSSRLTWNAEEPDFETIAVEGSKAVVQVVENNLWTITYLDVGQGHSAGLQEAKLQNRNGNFVESTDANIAAAVNANSLPSFDSNFDGIDFLHKPGAKTWPVTAISYGFLRVNQRQTGATGPLLKAVFRWLLSADGGQAHLEDYMFIVLPASVAADADAALDTIKLANGETEWLVEGATTLPNSAGAGGRVFSDKRRRYEGVIEAAVVEVQDDVESEVRSLRDQIAMRDVLILEMQHRVLRLEAAGEDSDGLLGEAEGSEGEGSAHGLFGTVDSDGLLGEAEGDSDGLLDENEGDSDGLLNENEGDSDGRLDENEGDSDGLLNENEGEGDSYNHSHATLLHTVSLTVAGVAAALALAALALAMRRGGRASAYMHHEAHENGQYVVRSGCLGGNNAPGGKVRLPCTKGGDDDSMGETVHINYNPAAAMDPADTR